MEVEGFGAFLRRKRTERGITQRELAELADTSPAYVSQLEGGRVGLPGVDFRRRFADALGISQIDFLVATGEVSREELDLPADPRSEATKRLQPRIDRVAWDEKTYQIIEAVLDTLAKKWE